MRSGCSSRTRPPDAPRMIRDQMRPHFRASSPLGGTQESKIAASPQTIVDRTMTTQMRSDLRKRTARDRSRATTLDASGVYTRGSSSVEWPALMTQPVPQPSATAIFYRNLRWLRFVDRFGRKGQQTLQYVAGLADPPA